MIWTEVEPCTGGVQWEAYPSETHAIDIWPHEKEGFSWCVITDNVDDNAPEGWSSTVDDAKRQAEQAYLEWLDVTDGRKPIPNEWLVAHDETAEIVAAAVAQERAAVVAFLRGARLDELADARMARDRVRHAHGHGRRLGSDRVPPTSRQRVLLVVRG